MEFLKELKSVGFVYEGPTRKKLKAGAYSLSVQASEKTYCLPRETLNLGEYTAMEVALFEDDQWVLTENFYSKFADFERLEELMGYSDERIFTYVPIDLIEAFYKYLKEVE